MSAGPKSAGSMGLPLRLVCTIAAESSPRCQRVSMAGVLEQRTSRLDRRAVTPLGSGHKTSVTAQHDQPWIVSLERIRSALGFKIGLTPDRRLAA